jgi:hypothetical protein
MKLDPEHQVIAAILHEAAFEQANEQVVAAQIEFPHEGCAKVTMTISRELVDRARALNWSTGELFAEAIRVALPGAFNIEAATPRAVQPTDPDRYNRCRDCSV